MQPAASCKAQDLPRGMSSMVTSETTVPPVCSDVIPPFRRARPTARTAEEPLFVYNVCNGHQKW